jgi:hypothetical protein
MATKYSVIITVERNDSEFTNEITLNLNKDDFEKFSVGIKDLLIKKG